MSPLRLLRVLLKPCRDSGSEGFERETLRMATARIGVMLQTARLEGFESRDERVDDLLMEEESDVALDDGLEQVAGSVAVTPRSSAANR